MPQIRLESKTGADEKGSIHGLYVSILRRPASRLSGHRYGFEITSGEFAGHVRE